MAPLLFDIGLHGAITAVLAGSHEAGAHLDIDASFSGSIFGTHKTTQVFLDGFLPGLEARGRKLNPTK